jgi:PadR family transcriptional regulator AphA
MSPMVKTPLTMEHALLGFLRDRPVHGYEMHQMLMEARELGLVWHLKQSQLYALLGRLEEAGYIDSTTEPQGTRPPRKLMSLTAEGRAAFELWLTLPVAHVRDFRLEFLAKLFFAGQDDPSITTALIERQRLACNDWLADLRSQLDAVSPERPFDSLVLQFRLGQLEAVLRWLDTCATTLIAPSYG